MQQLGSSRFTAAPGSPGGSINEGSFSPSLTGVLAATTVSQLFGLNNSSPCLGDIRARLLQCTLCEAALEDCLETATSVECSDHGSVLLGCYYDGFQFVSGCNLRCRFWPLNPFIVGDRASEGILPYILSQTLLHVMPLVEARWVAT